MNIFNAALVTPTYYVLFTSATIVTSAVLFQGFKGTGVSITTVIMGFLQICAGVVLLQLSKSAKDVPDTAIFKGDLDQMRQVAEQEAPESEPKADAIRGASSIIRRISAARQKMEEDEARRYYENRHLEGIEEPRENEGVEWDGIRRRRTGAGESPKSTTSRRGNARHPPLGMSKFPDFVDEDPSERPQTRESGRNFLGSIRIRSSTLHPFWRPTHSSHGTHDEVQPVSLTGITIGDEKKDQVISSTTEITPTPSLDAPFEPKELTGRKRSGTAAKPGSPPKNREERASSNSSHRQFSFGNLFHRRTSNEQLHVNQNAADRPAGPGRLFNFGNLGHRNHRHERGHSIKNSTEEESLGLVTGDTSDEKDQIILTQTSPSPAGSPRCPLPNDNEDYIHKKHPDGYHQTRRSISASSSLSNDTAASSKYSRQQQEQLPAYSSNDEHENYQVYPPNRLTSPEIADQSQPTRQDPSSHPHPHPDNSQSQSPPRLQVRRPLPALPDEEPSLNPFTLPSPILEEDASSPTELFPVPTSSAPTLVSTSRTPSPPPSSSPPRGATTNTNNVRRVANHYQSMSAKQ